MKRIFSPANARVYTEEDIQAVVNSLRSGHLSVVFGRNTIRFEKEFAERVGREFAVATSSGTGALELALQCSGIGFGDEVIVPGYTFGGVAVAILRHLAIVKFAEIDPDTWNVTAETVRPLLSLRTKAIIAPHTFGNPVDILPLLELARQHRVLLIEDCAQAAGASIHGRPVGAFGHHACFSFNEIKNMTTGEGGLLITDNKEVRDRALLLRLNGSENGNMTDLGTKVTMTEMEAALGRQQLLGLEEMNQKRRTACQNLKAYLEMQTGFYPQQIPASGSHVYSRFVFRIRENEAGFTRDELAIYLNRYGFTLTPFYPIPIYKQKLFASLAAGTPPSGFANSYHEIYRQSFDFNEYSRYELCHVERFCSEHLGFIVPPDISELQVDELINVFDAYFIKGGR